MNKLNPCTLTPQQEKLWSDTRVALLWHCPAFSHILYTMLDKAGSKYVAVMTKDVPIAATDGSSLIINPDTFFKYNLYERVFIVAHEILHCIWDHCGMMHKFHMQGKVPYTDGTSLPYNQMLMNVATDLVINDALIESKVGQYNPQWLHDTKIATAKDSALDAYKKLFQHAKKMKVSISQDGDGGDGDGNSVPGVNGEGFDKHMQPGTSQGKDPQTAVQQRNQAEWQTQLAAAANAARAQGKLPAGLERLFNEILDPKIDWRDKIQALFARKLGSGSSDWRRPDRRLITRDIYAPGRSGFGTGTVVVAVDTSGSIGDRELDMFFAEMAGILDDVRPKKLFVMWCDAALRRVDECEEPQDLYTIRCKGAPGGGGTDFRPVFDAIGKMGIQPEALVYLTDGCGSFPEQATSYPTIWGSISPKGAVKYPFGDVVEIPQQAR